MLYYYKYTNNNDKTICLLESYNRYHDLILTMFCLYTPSKGNVMPPCRHFIPFSGRMGGNLRFWGRFANWLARQDGAQWRRGLFVLLAILQKGRFAEQVGE